MSNFFLGFRNYGREGPIRGEKSPRLSAALLAGGHSTRCSTACAVGKPAGSPAACISSNRPAFAHICSGVEYL